MPSRPGDRNGHDDRQPRAGRRRPQAIVERARDSEETAIVITHGTDTMVETARALAAGALDGKTIVLTGAMVPYAFGSSDGLFNLGSALSFVQVLPARCLRRDERPALPVERRRRRTARLGSFRSRMKSPVRIDIEAARGRDDDLHRDVAHGCGAGRDQSVAGLSRFRLRSRAGRRGRPAHAGGAAINTRRCRGSCRCARRLPTSTRGCTSATLRSRHGGHGHVGRNRGHLCRRGCRARSRATKPSFSSPATTRTCRQSS